MKRYLTAANIVLIIIGLFFSIKVFHQIAAESSDYEPLIRTAGKQDLPRGVLVNRPLSYYQSIVKRNLFDTKKDISETAISVDVEALERTDLNLKLWGTVTGDGNEAYAVIEEIKGKKQNLYQQGDTVQNATIKMILRQKVVLSVDGKDEVLELTEAEDSKKTIRDRTPKTPHHRSLKVTRPQLEGAGKDIHSLMRQARIRPHFENGKPDGLLITSIKPGSIFSKMGLQSGDIIIDFDGEGIDSMDDAMKFYTRIKSSSDVRLNIKRNGRKEAIAYNIE